MHIVPKSSISFTSTCTWPFLYIQASLLPHKSNVEGACIQYIGVASVANHVQSWCSTEWSALRTFRTVYRLWGHWFCYFGINIIERNAWQIAILTECACVCVCAWRWHWAFTHWAMQEVEGGHGTRFRLSFSIYLGHHGDRWRRQWRFVKAIGACKSPCTALLSGVLGWGGVAASPKTPFSVILMASFN